jgi:peroxiredoxin
MGSGTQPCSALHRAGELLWHYDVYRTDRTVGKHGQGSPAQCRLGRCPQFFDEDVMGIKHWAVGAALVAFAGVGAFVYLDAGRSVAPESTFVLLDGSRQTTADLRGKVTLVNFWATSCTTCVAEMPEIIATHNKYHAKGFDTLAVAMSYDPPSYVVNFAESRKLPFKVALDNTGAVAKAWGDVRLTPSTFIVNKRGEIVKSYVGAPNFSELHQLIEKLLAET